MTFSALADWSPKLKMSCTPQTTNNSRDAILEGAYPSLAVWSLQCILILKIRKSKICRGAVGGGWGEILGNVYISWMCCGFVVNHTYQWWWGMGSNCSCNCSKYPIEVCLQKEMQRVYICYTTEITNHCYTAKITLCSMV